MGKFNKTHLSLFKEIYSMYKSKIEDHGVIQALDSDIRYLITGEDDSDDEE